MRIFAAHITQGEVSEWLKEHAWKVCIRETVSGVRIPLSPPKQSPTLIVGLFHWAPPEQVRGGEPIKRPAARSAGLCSEANSIGITSEASNPPLSARTTQNPRCNRGFFVFWAAVSLINGSPENKKPVRRRRKAFCVVLQALPHGDHPTERKGNPYYL